MMRSICAPSEKWEIPSPTIARNFLNCLFLLAYKLQNLQAWTKGDKKVQLAFSEQCSSHLDGYSEYLTKVFSLTNAYFEAMVS